MSRNDDFVQIEYELAVPLVMEVSVMFTLRLAKLFRDFDFGENLIKI